MAGWQVRGDVRRLPEILSAIAWKIGQIGVFYMTGTAANIKNEQAHFKSR